MILSLEIEGYKPLATKGTTYVKLGLAHIVNVFMGRNGFGKTSLLRMCMLNVPESKYFPNGGYRELVYKDAATGDTFVLRNGYGEHAIQSFKLNNVELNEANNQSVQKALCERYFRINFQTIRYLTGLRQADLFTTMSPMKRKELFMAMYPSDVSYALGVYNKIKAAHRIAVGGLKTQQSRLAEEQSRIASINALSEEELLSRIKTLEDDIKSALLLQGELANVSYDRGAHQKLIADFNQLVNTLANWSIGSGIDSRQSLLSELNEVEQLLSSKKDRVLLLQNAVNRIAESLSGTNLVHDNVDTVKAQLDEQQSLVNKLSASLSELSAWFEQEPYYSTQPDTIFKTLSVYQRDLTRYLNVIPLASRAGLKLAGYRGYLEQADALQSQIRGIKHRLDTVKHDLAHYDAQDTLNCPECNHQFKQGMSETQVTSWRNEVAQSTKTLSDLERTHTQLLDLIERDSEWYSSMQSLMTYLRQNDVNGVLLGFLKHYEPGSKVMDDAINGLQRCTEFVKTQQSLDTAMVELNTLRMRYKALMDNDMVTLVALYDEAERNLGEEEWLLNRYKRRLTEVQTKLDSLQAYELKLDVMRDMQKQIMETYESGSLVLASRSVGIKITELTEAKDDAVALLIRTKSANAVIDSIIQNVEELKEREGKLAILMDNLCPNKGLIAKQMSAFIENVCGNMNGIIKDIFSTPLYVLPCQNDSGNLTYVFPVINGDSESDKSDDVADCSGGESDVINFAFRLMLLRYYAKGFPLIMDEVGTKLDEYHQGRFFDYIRRLSLSGRIEQLFMVSHFTNHINVFDYANVVALNSEGISLPNNVNAEAIIR